MKYLAIVLCLFLSKNILASPLVENSCSQFFNQKSSASSFEAAEKKRLLEAAKRVASQFEGKSINEIPFSPTDKVKWNKLKGSDKVSLFGFLNNTKLNQTIQEAIKAGVQDKDLYDKKGKYHLLALSSYDQLQKIGSKIAQTREDFSANWDFLFNRDGSSLTFSLEGRKSDLQKILKALKPKSVGLRDNSESLPGNKIAIRDEVVFHSARIGARVVDIRRGGNRGYSVGPAKMVFEQEELPIYLEEIKEIPFFELTKEDLDGETWGLTLDEMANALKSYYKDFQPNDIITVVRFRIR